MLNVRAFPDARPSAIEALHHPWLEAATTEQGNSSTGGVSSPAVARTSPNEQQQNADRCASDRGSSSSSSSSICDDGLVQRLQRYGTYSRYASVKTKTCCPHATWEIVSKCFAGLLGASFSASALTPRGINLAPLVISSRNRQMYAFLLALNINEMKCFSTYRRVTNAIYERPI